MLDKLEAIFHRWEDIGEQLSDPATVSDMKLFTQLSKDYKGMQNVVEVYLKYKDVLSNIENNRNILKNESDPDFKDMAKMELDELVASKESMEDEIKILLIPKDPEDEKNAILEIRSGTGGDEASIFAADLYRMYSRYCDNIGFKVEILNVSENPLGGYREVSMNITGTNVYGTLKYESGVHRVQRVPVTESQGRVHTSAASVAVLPEAEEVDIVINPADLRVDTYRASGAGGQHVNKTESAVRITHIPTGVVAECQKERSQLRNREVAMTMLRTRIYEQEHKKHIDAIAQKRKTLVSTGDRSAKIRTYNWPQGRVTDHRIGLTLYHLDSIINGDLQTIIEKLQFAENAEKMKLGEQT